MLLKKNKQDVLLILPPFGSFHAPYISHAVLAGYLKSCNIPVSVFNASVFLMKKYCEQAMVEKGIETIQQSFRELNNKEQLAPSEAAKMTVLYPLLQAINQYRADQLPPETALQISAFPFWPDCLIKRPHVKLISAHSIFNSNDLVQAACKDYFFTDLLRGELQRKIDKTEPLLVGISTIFDEQMPTALHCARLIKELVPDVHVTMGGPFITAHLDDLDNPAIFSLVDTLIFDEGEIPLQRLYQEIDSGTPDLASIPGLMYLASPTMIKKNPSAPAPDMETLAFADYTACDLEQYPESAEKMLLAVRLSRGCYWQRCSFCRTNLSFCKNFQQPSVDRIFAEIQYIVQSTDVRKFLFSDESSHPVVLEQLSKKIINHDMDIVWTFHTRIDKKLTRERVALFSKAGCRGLQVGIETFSNRLLKVLRKGITEELIDEVLNNIQGIVPIHAYMMVGIPGETEEETDRSYTITQEYIKKGILQGANFSLFQLMPGSDMWSHPQKYRITLLQSDTENDLKPNICANLSVGEGMSREQAFTHFICFNYPGFENWKKQKQVLSLDGEIVTCNYPFGYLQEILQNSLIHQNDLPFKRWLEFIDDKNSPIFPYRSR